MSLFCYCCVVYLGELSLYGGFPRSFRRVNARYCEFVVCTATQGYPYGCVPSGGHVEEEVIKPGLES